MGLLRLKNHTLGLGELLNGYIGKYTLGSARGNLLNGYEAEKTH